MLAGGLHPIEESAGHWKELALCGVVSHVCTHPENGPCSVTQDEGGAGLSAGAAK